MFVITNLYVNNICQYDEFNVPVCCGLMAVCGKNGSGKTTLLRALMYGLTGLVDGSWGTQQSLQKDGSTTPGFVEVDFTDLASGDKYHIRRYSAAGAKWPDTLAEKKADLEWVFIAKGRKLVNEKLQGLFGISHALLFQLVWGRQGQLDQLLTSPAAYISTFLSSVFDLKHLEQLRDRLKNSIDSIAVMADPMNEITNLAVERKQLEDGLQQLKDNVEADQKAYDLASANLSDALVRSKSDAVVKAKQLQDLVESYKVGMLDLAQLRNILEKENGVPKEFFDSDADQIRALIPPLVEAVNGAMAKASALQEEADRIAVELGSINLQKTQLEYQVKTLKDAEQRKTALEPLPGGFCPLCEHAIDDNMDIFNQKVDAMFGFDPAQLKTAEEALTACCAKQQQLTEEAESISNKRLVEIDTVKSLTFDRHNYEGLLKYLEDKKKLDDNLFKQQHLKVSGVDQEAVYEAREEQRQVDVCKRRLESSKQALTAAETRIAVISGTLDRLEQEKEQYDINAEARQLLATLRDVFSQQRAQARYFASKITTLNARLQDFLESTGMPFSLRLNPDTRTFDYTTADGYQHPACHLSGAQKNISAVALQMALVEVIQPNLNLFLFDEPSEALDVENKYIMAEMFKKMNRLLPSIGGTMMIVSRDEQLIESCENVININQKEEELK